MKQSKNIIKINESQLKQMISESVKNIISEGNYKTYHNAAKKRLQQSKETSDPKKAKELWDKAWELGKYANKKFHDEYIGDYQYDTMEDKFKGEKSAKFDAYLSPTTGKMAYGNIRGWNKGGNEIFSTGKGKYYNHRGYVSPKQHFRDADVADAYSRANDELWDYENGNYEYVNGEGWKLKENVNTFQLKQMINESVKKVLKENDDVDKRYGNREIDNVLEDFNELKNAILTIRDRYSFDNYLEHLESSIDALCGVINEYQRVYYTEFKK